MILNPDYPHIVWSFTYRGWQLEVDQSAEDGQAMYAVWASHNGGCAVAVPCAFTRADAVKRAKKYVDARIRTPTIGIV